MFSSKNRGFPKSLLLRVWLDIGLPLEGDGNTFASLHFYFFFFPYFLHIHLSLSPTTSLVTFAFLILSTIPLEWLSVCVGTDQGQPITNVNDKSVINSDIEAGVRGWERMFLFKFQKLTLQQRQACNWFGGHLRIKVFPACQTESSQITCFGSRTTNWRLFCVLQCFSLRPAVKGLTSFGFKSVLKLSRRLESFDQSLPPVSCRYKNGLIVEAMGLDIKYLFGQLELI